jgi:hypothetical protein
VRIRRGMRNASFAKIGAVCRRAAAATARPTFATGSLIGKIRRECVDFLIPLNEPSWCRITTRVAHTRVSARGFPTDHRVPRHDQPVIGFRAGIVAPPLPLSAVSITNTALSRTQRDFLRAPRCAANVQ